MADIFEIATDDGSVFCKCSNETGTPMLIGKEGTLSLQRLMDQAYHPELAKKMRSKKHRGRRQTKQGINL